MTIQTPMIEGTVKRSPIHLINQTRPQTLHPELVNFEVRCDALTIEDCMAAAAWLLPAVGRFGSVEFVPSRSNLVPQWLAQAFWAYVTEGSHTVLICDDVLTTGASMEKQRANRMGVGAVILARGVCPGWIQPLLELNHRCGTR